jgi:hypothetical protein
MTDQQSPTYTTSHTVPGAINRPGYGSCHRHTSEYAVLSLARMASLETGHVHSPHDERECDEDNSSYAMCRPHDIENGTSEPHAERLAINNHDDLIRPAAGPGDFGHRREAEPKGTASELEEDPSSETGVETKCSQEQSRLPQSGLESRESPDGESPSGARTVVQLQDQTNLLPVKQVVFVFLGLSCALFVSQLDQTMYVTAVSSV